MDFDKLITRRGTGSLKWDATSGVSSIDGDDVLPMWVADTDFRIAPVIEKALQDMATEGVTGYFCDLPSMQDAVAWWMQTRHQWTIDPAWVQTTHGLGNAIALILETLTEPGDGVVMFSPVYHAFAGRTKAAGRRVVEVPLVVEGGQQKIDFDHAAASMDGTEKIVILSSPHNPGGRVWTADELRALGDFAQAHDLFVVADEIHHDLVYPGHRFRPMAAVTDIADRLVTITAPSKTFNTAGLRVGHIIIEDDALRARMADTLNRFSIQPNWAGVRACRAAYSPEGAEWVDAQMAYLDANRRAFDDALNAIPGVRSTPLEATYLAWVDFTGTGMTEAELVERVETRARIVVNKGSTFGPGGDGYLRFNIGTQRARIDEATRRLQDAFSDLQ